MAELERAGGIRRVGLCTWLACAALVAVAGCSRDPEEAPRVETDGEVLEGAWVDAERSVAVFKGVRYAAPPVDERRWRPPAPIEPRRGVQPAKELGLP